MILKELKSNFESGLRDQFPAEEIQSFFTLLSENVFGYSRFQVSLHAQEPVSERHQRMIENALERLRNYEPIQYVLGETEFFGLPFQVNEHTLIPRPETEELVEWVISECRDRDLEFQILDIGTGSGCIAISLAKNIENAKVSALDISEKALKIARHNAAVNEVEVDLFVQDILGAHELPQTYDVIVSNPPYVRDREKELMEKNVLNFEPYSALFVRDEDPLAFYRVIAEKAKQKLKANGFLFFEINEYLSKEMVLLLTEMSFNNIEIKNDIYNKPRMLKCTL